MSSSAVPPFPSASLYVGDLASEVSEGHLFEIFNTVGAVASIRVCRDAVTRRSLGYAYVNFHTTADAEEALEQLNNSPIKGKPCRIMWSQRDPSLRKSGVGNIFIKNLHKSIDHKALYDTFSVFGNILSCKVALDENGESKGYGFVHYETQEMADRAIEKVNEMMLKGQQVYVGRFIPKKERVKNREAQGFTNIYVKNLPESLDEEGLKTLFSPYGPFTSVALATDGNGKSKGFGFINFENPVEAKRSVEEMNEKTVNGKQLYVGRAQKKAERQAELKQKYRSDAATRYQGVNLYVKNLSDDIDDAKLNTEFSAFGNITSAEVMKDEKGNSKGFGFVCFTTPEEATKAVAEMNGRHLGSKPIYVALAQRKDVRKAQLMAQHAQRLKTGFQANGLNVPNVYGAPGAPVFYPQTAQAGNIPQQFMYHQLIQQQRNRWPQNPQFQPMHNYMVPVRPPRHNNARQMPNRGRYNNRNPREQASPQIIQAQSSSPQSVAEQPVGTVEPLALTPSILEQYTREQQSSIIGERLFGLISKLQPEWAGKITGMLLDRLNSGARPEELLHLIEDHVALNDKVAEALEVLEAHAMEAQAQDVLKEADVDGEH